MNSKKSVPITHQIYETIFKLLEKNPDGLRWVDLNKMVEESNSNYHPKTVNGCVWKVIEKYPDKVYKPKKGLFRLLKYKRNS